MDRIVPEWQDLSPGDTVFATQPGYRGSRRGLGWTVARVNPGEALVLENWGAFVLRPLEGESTRLIVRTAGGGGPARGPDLSHAPVGLLLFEVPHFVMERRMLLGIRALAERERGAGGQSDR